MVMRICVVAAHILQALKPRFDHLIAIKHGISLPEAWRNVERMPQAAFVNRQTNVAKRDRLQPQRMLLKLERNNISFRIAAEMKFLALKIYPCRTESQNATRFK